MKFVLLAGLSLACACAQAQTMYRCGNVYQDRPCDAGKAGRAVGSTGTGAPAGRSAVTDAECAQRGKDSLKIVWAREGGAAEERLLAQAATAAQKRLVQDVYRRRGAASQVQAAVEADCVAEKEKAERDAALAAAEAVRAQREGRSPSVTGDAVPQPAADPDADARTRSQEAAQEAERKKSACAQYNTQLDSLRVRERTGGSAATMDSLNEQRRSLRDQMSRAGC
jgi:hypothetical protein